MKFKNSILELFAESPMKPLQTHMDLVCNCADLLAEFIVALAAGDLDKATEIQQKIVVLETEADELKKQIRANLPKNLFLPVPRTDLLTLLKKQDKIANKSRNIAGLMLGRQMSIPELIRDDMISFANLCVHTTKQAQRVVHELEVLVISSFAGRPALNTVDIIALLDDIEHQTDQLQINIRRKLFTVEKEMYPIDVIFLYKSIEQFGELANNAQTVGHQMGVLLAK